MRRAVILVAFVLPVIERAKKSLAEAANRVCSAPGQTAFTWLEPKDRTVADRVRLEILDTLVALKDAMQ